MKTNHIHYFKQVRFLLVFCLLTAGVACHSKNTENNASSVLSTADIATESTSDGTMASPPVAGHPVKETNPSTKIIRKATVKMQVNDFRESLTAIENTIATHQAFVVESNETHTNDQLENTLTIRVPAAHLDALLNKLISHGVYLNYKNISSEDVSTEFVDITARIKSKKVVEERYLTFLKEAKNVKEMLALENEVRKIREEIEATQARINYINTQTAYSTITLEIYQPITIVAPTGNSYWVRVVNALGTGWEALLFFLIGLLYLWPLLLVLPILIYLSRRFLQKYPPVR